MEDPQVLNSIAMRCIPHVSSFLCRVVPPDQLLPYLSSLQTHLRAVLSKGLGIDLTDSAWRQARFPIKLGGLGYGNPTISAHAAYLASVMACEDRVGSICGNFSVGVVCKQAIDAIKRLTNDKVDPLSLALGGQGKITTAIWECEWESWRQLELDPIVGATIDSFKSTYSGRWLEVTPNAALGLAMSPDEFVTCVKSRLGLVVSVPDVCRACGNQADAYGRHAEICTTGQLGPKARHDKVRDIIAAEACAAGFRVAVEPRHILAGRTKEKPADILIGTQCVDVTIPSPLTIQTLTQRKGDPETAIKIAATEKHKKWDEKCKKAGVSCCAFVVDSFG